MIHSCIMLAKKAISNWLSTYTREIHRRQIYQTIKKNLPEISRKIIKFQTCYPILNDVYIYIQFIINSFFSSSSYIIINYYNISQMGCCCFYQQKQEQVNEVPNKSSLLLNYNQGQSKQKSNQYREQGKIYFNSRQFTKSIESYKLALVNDPQNVLNYSNLALALKALNNFQESIDTIKRMEKIQMIKNEDIPYFVKGEIIKARCQNALAKRSCLQHNSFLEANSLKKANNLLEQAIVALQSLKQNPKYNEYAAKLNAEQYLQDSFKLRQIISQLNRKYQKNENITNFLKKKLKSKKAQEQFMSFNMLKYYQKPQDILVDVEEMEEERKKKLIQQQTQQQQQFTIDPITYVNIQQGQEQYKDPIIVKSGLTYEQQTLKTHYNKNGSHDPITKQKYSSELGIKNNTLRAYIQQTKKQRHLNELKLIDL